MRRLRKLTLAATLLAPIMYASPAHAFGGDGSSPTSCESSAFPAAYNWISNAYGHVGFITEEWSTCFYGSAYAETCAYPSYYASYAGVSRILEGGAGPGYSDTYSTLLPATYCPSGGGYNNKALSKTLFDNCAAAHIAACSARAEGQVFNTGTTPLIFQGSNVAGDY